MYPMSIELRFNCVRWRAHVDHFTFLLERIKTSLIGYKTERNEKHISRTVTHYFQTKYMVNGFLSPSSIVNALAMAQYHR